MSTQPSEATAQEVGAHVAQLFEQHGRLVYALSRLLMRDRLDAEDATQQTFLAAHRYLLGGGTVEQPAAWLATIARNECRSRLSRRPPATVPLTESARAGSSSDPALAAERQEEIAALSSALAELPQTQREAVILREFYGLSYREVSAALGLTGPAVESVLFKSRKRLQEKLRPIRVGSNALALPLAVRDALAGAIPGFGPAAGAGTGAVAAAKVTAVVAALAVAGTATTVATKTHHGADRRTTTPSGAAHPFAPSTPPVLLARTASATSIAVRTHALLARPAATPPRSEASAPADAAREPAEQETRAPAEPRERSDNEHATAIPATRVEAEVSSEHASEPADGEDHGGGGDGGGD